MKNRVTVTVRQADERSSVLCLRSRSFLFFKKVCSKGLYFGISVLVIAKEKKYF